MKRETVNISKEKKEALREIKEKHGIPINVSVDKALEPYIKQYQAKKNK